MNKFAQPFFITLAANVVATGLGFLVPLFLIVVVVALAVELFAGLALLFSAQRRYIGLALLAASGVSLLIAGFVCSSMSYGFH